jgi:hypothetical protein
MDQAAADQRARCVKFGDHAFHAEWFKQPGFEIVAYHLNAHCRIGAGGQCAGRQIGQDYGSRAGIFELAAGIGFERLGFGIGGHIVPPVEEQHPHLVALIGRIACLGVAQPRPHLKQLAQRNLAARIAAALPGRNRHAFIKPQPPIGNQFANHHAGYGLGHRP